MRLFETSPEAHRCSPQMRDADQVSALSDTGSSIGGPGRVDEPARNLDLRMQCTMDRTFLGDFEEALALRRIERAAELDGSFDPIDLAFLGLAIGAVGGVDLRVRQLHGD